jgi:cob(I)alamin adenosyltransferase
MPNNAREEARNMVDVTRRLSDMNLDLIKEARRTIRATHETVQRARQMLQASDEDFAVRQTSVLSKTTSAKTQLREARRGPTAFF